MGYHVGARSGYDQVPVREMTYNKFHQRYEFWEDETANGPTIFWTPAEQEFKVPNHTGHDQLPTIPPMITVLPIPEEQGGWIETFPEGGERSFRDYILILPIPDLPAVYVYFSKPPVEISAERGISLQDEKLAEQAQQGLIDELNKFKSNTQAEKVAAIIGAYDPVTGETSIGYSNSAITVESLHPATVSYIEKRLGVEIGEFTSFCKNKVGACAEVDAANRLVNLGAKPENIKFIQAIRPKAFRQENGNISDKVIVETCDNCKFTWPKGTK